MDKKISLQQGDIYLVKLDPAKHTEIGKTRPAAVLTTSIVLENNSDIVLVCPLSTKSRPQYAGLHIELPPRGKLYKTSFSLIEHCRSISSRRIASEKLGQLTADELSQILSHLQCIVGL